MKVRLWEIFLVFVKTGAILLGGGYVILPILEDEVVQKRGWINSDELVDYYAISQCIPGITAADVSMFIGYKLRGKRGAWTAGIGVCFTPFLSILFLAFILNEIVNYPVVKSLFWGISVGVIVLITLSVREMWGKSIVDKTTLFLFISVFVVTACFNISPVYIIIFALIWGMTRHFIREKRKRE